MPEESARKTAGKLLGLLNKPGRVPITERISIPLQIEQGLGGEPQVGPKASNVVPKPSSSALFNIHRDEDTGRHVLMADAPTLAQIFCTITQASQLIEKTREIFTDPDEHRHYTKWQALLLSSVYGKYLEARNEGTPVEDKFPKIEQARTNAEEANTVAFNKALSQMPKLKDYLHQALINTCKVSAKEGIGFNVEFNHGSQSYDDVGTDKLEGAQWRVEFYPKSGAPRTVPKKRKVYGRKPPKGYRARRRR